MTSGVLTLQLPIMGGPRTMASIFNLLQEQVRQFVCSVSYCFFLQII